MTVKPWAEFTSDLPDDVIETEDGSGFIQYGGKSVAAAIGEILTRLGGVVSPPIYADEHGWELDAVFGKRRLWGQITLIEGWLFVFQDPAFLPKLLGRPHPIYLDVLTRLADELARDSRFHNVRWYSSNQVLSGLPGDKTPVS